MLYISGKFVIKSDMDISKDIFLSIRKLIILSKLLYIQNIKLKTICCFNFMPFFSSFSNKLFFKGSLTILFNSINSSLFPSINTSPK